MAEISSSTREKLQQFSRTPSNTKFQLLLHRKIKVKSSFRELLMEKVVRIEDHIPKSLGVGFLVLVLNYISNFNALILGTVSMNDE